MKRVHFSKPKEKPLIWTNPDLKLYHGTLKKHVRSIQAGIDIRKCDDGTDFGLGFYTTTSAKQAARFAHNKVWREGGTAAVIEFTLNRDALATFESMWFVRSARNSDDFWTLVTACRRFGETNRGGDSWYDVVVGPVARRFQKRTYYPQYDQVSFHTERATRLLDGSLTGVKILS